MRYLTLGFSIASFIAAGLIALASAAHAAPSAGWTTSNQELPGVQAAADLR
jgi:hypothetical protein